MTMVLRAKKSQVLNLRTCDNSVPIVYPFYHGGIHKKLFYQISQKIRKECRKIDILSMVPLTGLEPVRILLRGILSPLCLPIPPQRRCFYYTTRSVICQGLFEKNLIFFLFLQIPCISSRTPPLFFRSNRFYIHEPLPCSIRIHSTSRKNQLFYLTNQNRHAIITLLYNTVTLE